MEVGGEADPDPRGDALVPGQGDEKDRGVPAAPDHPVRRLALSAQSRCTPLQDQREHGVGVPRVDLGHPLGGYPVLREVAARPVVEHQPRAGLAQHREFGGEGVDRPGRRARVSDRALGGPAGRCLIVVHLCSSAA